ncbi:MAG: hypothetical protein U1E36_01500 [Rickettsiales bacterium]
MSIVVKLALVVAVALIGCVAWLGMHEPSAPKQAGEIQLESKNFIQ